MACKLLAQRQHGSRTIAIEENRIVLVHQSVPGLGVFFCDGIERPRRRHTAWCRFGGGQTGGCRQRWRRSGRHLRVGPCRCLTPWQRELLVRPKSSRRMIRGACVGEGHHALVTWSIASCSAADAAAVPKSLEA